MDVPEPTPGTEGYAEIKGIPKASPQQIEKICNRLEDIGMATALQEKFSQLEKDFSANKQITSPSFQLYVNLKGIPYSQAEFGRFNQLTQNTMAAIDITIGFNADGYKATAWVGKHELTRLGLDKNNQLNATFNNAVLIPYEQGVQAFLDKHFQVEQVGDKTSIPDLSIETANDIFGFSNTPTTSAYTDATVRGAGGPVTVIGDLENFIPNVNSSIVGEFEALLNKDLTVSGPYTDEIQKTLRGSHIPPEETKQINTAVNSLEGALKEDLKGALGLPGLTIANYVKQLASHAEKYGKGEIGGKTLAGKVGEDSQKALLKKLGIDGIVAAYQKDATLISKNKDIILASMEAIAKPFVGAVGANAIRAALTPIANKVANVIRGGPPSPKR